MAPIPEWFVDEVRKRTDIVDVVSEHVQLRRTGRSYTGLCPFHNERSPSFSVSPDRQLFHCFGCGAGGTVIHFVMDIEGIDFVTAMLHLAERAQMEVPPELQTSSASTAAGTTSGRMRDAHELAAKLYNYILMNTSAGVQALNYLKERGISQQTVAEHRLGFAPVSDDTVTSFLKRRGFDAKFLTEAGLTVQMGNRIVDRFRGRMMIPITNARGQVVAFGGRAIHPDVKPKYLNSPETPVFQKGKLLYNQYVARREIRQTGTAVLLEGYMDVIAASQAGIRNAVASLGTSFTEEQASVIKRWCNRLVIAYDGDEAGQAATERAAQLAVQAELDVRIVALPDGLDPDEFIRTHGSTEFQTLVQERTLTMVEFLFQRLRNQADIRTTSSRNEFLRQALQLLQQWATPIEQETMFKRLSQEFHVTVETLKEELTQVSKQSKRAIRKLRQDSRTSTTERVAAGSLPKGHVTAANRLLQAALQDASAVEFLMEHNVTELVTVEQTALLANLYAFHADHPEASPADFVEYLQDPQWIGLASSLLVEDAPSTEHAVLEDYLRTIQLHRAESTHRALLDESIRAQTSGDAALVEDLKQRIADTQRQIQQLKLPHASSLGLRG